ncbi:uncharacterized protein TNCV_4662131 [Trichonephila clavipes]|uniref:Uncharacterized protein n=1 Tax=Trichonephila clavipes TaxID=2585209 RepID=A0A8X6V8M8_TRICX|nr:uncharacterized protein TNCV_4662131 [Trichonephila clavipes]
MAALVSEYTLEFFTLLNARGKKELIEWCMKEGIIASSYECPKCNEQMGLNERKSVVLDGFEWRCRKKSHAEGMFDHYLAEYLWRRSRDHSLSDETFQNFLKAVVTLYPPLGKDQQ